MGVHAHAEDWLLSGGGGGGGRDETAFYQAESQMLTRENQMLRVRIRELGKCCFGEGGCGREVVADGLV